MLSPVYFTSVILLIIFSSVLTPIALKALYAFSPDESIKAAEEEASNEAAEAKEETPVAEETPVIEETPQEQ